MLQALSLAVVIHLSNLAGAPPSLVLAAQTEVARVYTAIGASVRWQPSEAATDLRTIQLVLLPVEPGALRRATDPVMGAAVRTAAGTGIAYVYYTRVMQQASQHDVSSAMVLAYAISHELGHLLLGSREHSTDGLMRACWRRAEFHEAGEGMLHFSPHEIAAIRTRLEMPGDRYAPDARGSAASAR